MNTFDQALVAALILVCCLWYSEYCQRKLERKIKEAHDEGFEVIIRGG